MIERALYPWLVVSQMVPIPAVSPVGLGGDEAKRQRAGDHARRDHRRPRRREDRVLARVLRPRRICRGSHEGRGLVTVPVAPRGWFELLLDQDDAEGLGLPDGFRAVYGGDWLLPRRDQYVYVNFCIARAGRASCQEPAPTAADLAARFEAADLLLTGLPCCRRDTARMDHDARASEPARMRTPYVIYP